jgi:hypothetical protein
MRRQLLVPREKREALQAQLAEARRAVVREKDILDATRRDIERTTGRPLMPFNPARASSRWEHARRARSHRQRAASPALGDNPRVHRPAPRSRRGARNSGPPGREAPPHYRESCAASERLQIRTVEIWRLQVRRLGGSRDGHDPASPPRADTSSPPGPHS